MPATRASPAVFSKSNSIFAASRSRSVGNRSDRARRIESRLRRLLASRTVAALSTRVSKVGRVGDHEPVPGPHSA